MSSTSYVNVVLMLTQYKKYTVMAENNRTDLFTTLYIL